MPGLITSLYHKQPYTPYMGAIFNGITGKSQRIQVADNSTILSLSTFSCVALVKHNGYLGQTFARRIFDKGSGAKKFLLDPLSSGSPELFVSFSTTNGNWKVKTLKFGNFSGKVQQFAVTYDGTSVSNVPTFYVNGLAVPSVTGTTPQGSISADTGNLHIGNASGDLTTFNGPYYYFMYFNRVISPIDVNNIFYESVDPRSISGLVIWHDYRQRHFLDLSNKGNNGISGTSQIFFGNI